MTRKQSLATAGRYRALLSDVLPYEIPLTFSNRKLLKFFADNRVDVSLATNGNYKVSWVCENDRLDAIMFMIFGKPTKNTEVMSTISPFRGRKRSFRSYAPSQSSLETIPFRFKITHKHSEPRELTIVHPRNQMQVCEFYSRFAGPIIYSSSKSEYSIRRPVAVAQTVFFKDETHYSELDVETATIEQSDKEYEISGSFFSYQDYSNIHRFFESPKYHRSERKFRQMLKMDISKCFDSIYTHSIAWAINGKEQTKDNISSLNGTFADKFDSILTKMNRSETNGITIGSEFSRIFAEIILQSVDACVLKRLQGDQHFHRVDYEIYRYVDDYFIFFNDQDLCDKIVNILHEELREFKLNLNTSKTLLYQKPIITEITIAKAKITGILDEILYFSISESENEVDPSKKIIDGDVSVRANDLITKVKSAMKEAGVTYNDILNYTLAVTEKRCDRIVKRFFRVPSDRRKADRFVGSLLAIVEFAFFIYSGSPKVNFTIRICRVCHIIIQTLKNPYFSSDQRHSVFKMIFDCSKGIMKLSAADEFRQIETIYLLSLIKELGRDYWLDEATLRSFLGVDKDKEGLLSTRFRPNYFLISSALHYMDDKKRYSAIKGFFQHEALKLLEERRYKLAKDTESLLLTLDLLVSPYITTSVRDEALSKWQFSAEQNRAIVRESKEWFTEWRAFDFGSALDKKRSREVY